MDKSKDKSSTKKDKTENYYGGAFLLYPQHKDFLPGKSPLEFGTLPTSIKTSDGCLGGGLFGLFLIAMFIWAFGGAINEYLIDHTLMNEAEEISVQVHTCQLQPFKKGQRPLVRYNYTVNDTIYSGQQLLYGSSCDGYPQGSTLSAVYLPSDPSWVRFQETAEIRGQTQAIGAICFLPIGIIVLVLLLVVMDVSGLYQYVRARRMYPRLKKYGDAVEGQIVSISGYTRAKTTEFYVRVTYQFETPDKRVLTGHAEAHRQDLKDKILPSAGRSIVVLYADDHAYMML